MNKLNLTEEKVKRAIAEVFAGRDDKRKVKTVQLPDENSSCMFVVIRGDAFLDELVEIGEKFGSDGYLISSFGDDELSLCMHPQKDPDVVPEEDDEDQDPHIELHHKGRFEDAEELIIPGTKIRVSNTEMCEQIMAWVKKSGRYPLYWQHLEDGVHVEVSKLADERIKHVLEQCEAIGMDGKTYEIEYEPGSGNVELVAMGGSICARASLGDDNYEWFGLDYFV